MKCPKCGKEIKDGSLFCEYCFADIRIVPTYKASDGSIEQQINETMTDIAHDVHREVKKEKRRTERSEQLQSFKQSARRIAIVSSVVIGIFLIILFGFWLYRQQSESYLMRRAQKLADEGNYTEAADYIQRALYLADNSTDHLLLKRAEYLHKAGQKEEAYVTAQIVATSYDTDLEDRTEAYRLMILILSEDEKYQEIGQLLAQCDDAAVQEEFKEYMIFAPTFEPEEGTYEDELTVTISVNGSGSIFYTLDGTDPSTSSSLYSGPIVLYEGEYLLKVISINHFGEISDVVSGLFVVTSEN